MRIGGYPSRSRRITIFRIGLKSIDFRLVRLYSAVVVWNLEGTHRLSGKGLPTYYHRGFYRLLEAILLDLVQHFSFGLCHFGHASILLLLHASRPNLSLTT